MGACNSGNNEKNRQRNPSRFWAVFVDFVATYAAAKCTQPQKIDDPYARRIAFWTMITGIGTILAAGLAGVAAAIFWAQLGTMQEQLRTQEADFRIDQRPILAAATFPAGTHVPQGFGYDQPNVRWNYAIKNYGKGTAFEVRNFDYLSVLGSHFRGIKKGEDRSTLVPTEDVWATAVFAAPVTPEREMAALNANGGIILKVVIKYKDAYGAIYEADVCEERFPNTAIGNCDLSQLHIPTDDDQDEKNYK